MKLGYGDVEGIALSTLGAEPSVVGSRFRYFQRLGFPAGTNTGRGKPASYELDQLLQILLAFELLAAGMSPTRVVRTLRTNWPRIRATMQLGWEAVSEVVEWDEREILTLEPAALEDTGRKEDPLELVARPLAPIPASAIQGWLTSDEGDARLLMVDPGRMLLRLRRVFTSITALEISELEESFATVVRR